MYIRIGDITAHKVVESVEPFQTLEEMFPEFPEMDVEMLNSTARKLASTEICSNTNRLIMSFHSWLIQSKTHNILIDTCIGCNKSDSWREAWQFRIDDSWLKNLENTGVTPENIDIVLCTHLHLDHCGWNTQLDNGQWSTTFPNAKYLFIPEELEHAKQSADSRSVFNENILPILEAGQAQMVKPDHVIDECVKLLPLPGHTPGHIGVHINSNGEEAVMCGDMIHSPVQCIHPDWQTDFDTDPELAKMTRVNSLKQYEKLGMLVLTAHFPESSVGRFKKFDGDKQRYYFDYLSNI